MGLREITYFAVAARIIAAVIFGGLLGLERGLKNRPAGLRTYMLVCVGSCLIMLTNQYIYQATASGDPVRMGAQVVSGIGFLGAGTIIVTRRSQIKGLTTAAGLWAAAGVGLALGIGFYEGAIAGALAVFFVITLLQGMDSRMHRKTRQLEVYVELEAGCSLGDLLRQAHGAQMNVSDVQRESPDSEESGGAYILTLKTRKRCHHTEFAQQVRQMEGVKYLEEL